MADQSLEMLVIKLSYLSDMPPLHKIIDDLQTDQEKPPLFSSDRSINSDALSGQNDLAHFSDLYNDVKVPPQPLDAANRKESFFTSSINEKDASSTKENNALSTKENIALSVKNNPSLFEKQNEKKTPSPIDLLENCHHISDKQNIVQIILNDVPDAYILTPNNNKGKKDV